MSGIEKTNAMRMLDAAGIEYRAHAYPHGDRAVDAVTVAELTGRDPGQVFKTLVTAGAPGRYYVFVIPADGELDLKAAARAVGEKAVEMIHVRDINRITGYIRGGCSPVGMKKRYPTVIDASCLSRETVLVSGGRIGLQVEVAPQDLQRAADAKILPVCRETNL